MKMDDTIDLKEIDRIVAEIGTGAGKVIPILHAVQKAFNYLPDPALRRVCEITEITPAGIAGISTFYSQFRHTPVGKHIIQVCTGTACHMKGAELVYDAFGRELKIEGEKDTDPEGLFTLQTVACLGCCTIAPVVQIDGVTYGHVQSDGVSHILEDFLKEQARGRDAGDGRKDVPPAADYDKRNRNCNFVFIFSTVNYYFSKIIFFIQVKSLVWLITFHLIAVAVHFHYKYHGQASKNHHLVLQRLITTSHYSQLSHPLLLELTSHHNYREQKPNRHLL